MRRPPWARLVGIVMLAALPGCAGFQQREPWFAEGEAPARPASTGLFSWWRGSAGTPPAAPAETERVTGQDAPEPSQNVWPEPRSAGVFRFFPWARRQPASTSTHQLMAPFQGDDPAQDSPSVHLSAKAGRPKPHGLPEPGGEVELDVNARKASADEPAEVRSTVRGATPPAEDLLPGDLSAAGAAAQPRLASSAARLGIESSAAPALLLDEEPVAEPAPEPVIAQEPPGKPAQPAPIPPPPATTPKPAPIPPPPPVTPKPAPTPPPPAVTPKPMAPTPPPPSIAPDVPPATAAPKPVAAPEPAPAPAPAQTTPPPAPPVPSSVPAAEPAAVSPPAAAAEQRQSSFKWLQWPSAEPIRATPQFPPVQFPAAYYTVAQGPAAPTKTTPAPSPQRPPVVATPQTTAPAHDHNHWRPGMYTMAFLQKCKDAGRGLGRGFGCCSCCTCPTCKKPVEPSAQALAAPQAAAPVAAKPDPVATAPPQPPAPVAAEPPAAKPAPVATAAITPGELINQLFPEGDPVLHSPSIRLARAQPGDVAQGGQVVQGVLAQGVDETPKR